MNIAKSGRFDLFTQFVRMFFLVETMFYAYLHSGTPLHNPIIIHYVIYIYLYIYILYILKPIQVIVYSFHHKSSGSWSYLYTPT
jgi:hypothetical protein